MNTVDEIFDLINKDNSIETFNKNKELFQTFYYHNMSIKYCGPKVIEIYKYLLSLNISEEHEDMPYINSKIFEDFNNYIMTVTQSVYLNGTNVDDKYINSLYELINTYNEFSKYSSRGELTKLQDYDTFVRNYTGAMIIILNSSFFNISNENINTLMSYVKNNSYLQKIIGEGKSGKRLLDKDYLFQYASRFLFNSEFVNSKNIDNDILINAIKNYKINDKETLQRLFNNINIYHLLKVFDNDLVSLVDVLDNSIKGETDRIELFNLILNKLISEDEYRIMADFIINDERSNKYLTKDQIEYISTKFSLDYPLNITDKEIEYVLANNKNPLFLLNLKSDYPNKNWSEETNSKVEELTENIPDRIHDFDSSIKLLDSVFKGNDKISVNDVISSLKCILRTYLNNNKLKIYIVYNNSINGCAYTGENCIKINFSLIKELVDTKNHEEKPESIHVLETIFHEARHMQQFLYMNNESMGEEIYTQYKEDLLTCISSNYYKKNYIGVSFEKDARTFGARMTALFLDKHFPHMKKSVDYYNKKSVEEQKKEYESKSVFELSKDLSINEIIDKLVSINPSIIEDFPYLRREYNEQGIRKDSALAQQNM